MSKWLGHVSQTIPCWYWAIQEEDRQETMCLVSWVLVRAPGSFASRLPLGVLGLHERAKLSVPLIQYKWFPVGLLAWPSLPYTSTMVCQYLLWLCVVPDDIQGLLGRKEKRVDYGRAPIQCCWVLHL